MSHSGMALRETRRVEDVGAEIGGQTAESGLQIRSFRVVAAAHSQQGWSRRGKNPANGAATGGGGSGVQRGREEDWMPLDGAR